jgi:hypothetical protein
MACMQMLPRDIILLTAMADLPIDIDRKHDVELLEGRGASLWYLACECDDFHIDVVEEIISLCTHSQARALSLLKGASGEALVKRATPGCRSVLQSALRLAGRFEFTDSEVVFADDVRGLNVFKALDFADHLDSDGEGKRVLLKNFRKRNAFEEEVCTYLRLICFAMGELS